MAGRKKKVVTDHQWVLLKELGSQLAEARDRASLTGQQLAPLAGYETHSQVSKVENGKADTDASNVLAWADACGHEVLVVPKGSVQALAARLMEAQEGERLLALGLLEVLSAAREAGNPIAATSFARDIDVWRDKLKRDRLLTAG